MIKITGDKFKKWSRKTP